MSNRTLLLPIFATIAACSSADATAPHDDDEMVATEATESPVAVTDTPGKAVWTKLWRWETDQQPITAADVAADETGAQYLLRTFAFTNDADPPRVQMIDVTRYSATGAMGFRVGFGAGGYDRYAAHIAARAGRIGVVATQTLPYSPYSRVGVVKLVSTSG